MPDSLRPYTTVALQAALPMGFSRQEYYSGLPFPSPGDLVSLFTRISTPRKLISESGMAGPEDVSTF